MKTNAAIVACLMLAACHDREPQPQPHPEDARAAATEVLRLTPTTLDVALQLPGELSPYLAVDMRARVSGFVGEITVDRGSQVHKDQLLVTLRAPELSAQRAEAEANAQTQDSTYQRLLEAAKTPGAVADQEVDVAHTTFEASQARVTSLATLEGYTKVRAPFDGLITRRNVHPGSMVTPTDAEPLLRIEDVARLRLTVAVPENASGSVRLGTQMSFTVSAYPGERFSGILRRSAGSVDTVTRTLPVELDVTNSDGRLAPGAYTEVAWPVRREHTFVVPRTALVQTPTRLFVVCVRDGKAVRVDVRRGLTRGDDEEIFGEVRDGDLIVKRASEDLADGTPVHIQ